MAGRPEASITAWALRKAFSSKVAPVSSTSTSTPASDSSTTSTPSWERMSFISISLWAFLLANTNFMPLNLPAPVSGWPGAP